MFGAQSSSAVTENFPHTSAPSLYTHTCRILSQRFFIFFSFDDSLHEFLLPTHPPHNLLHPRTSNVIIIIIIIVIGSPLLPHDCQDDDRCCVIIIIRHHYYRETHTQENSTSRTQPPKVRRYCGRGGKRHKTVVTEKIIRFG